MVKIVQFGVCVLNDSKHSFDEVIDTFQELLGWDVTQAANAAQIIHRKGEYVIRWYNSENDALYMLSLLRSKGLGTKLIIDRTSQIE